LHKYSKCAIFKLMSRLSIEVSSEQHQKIKALAALQGKSIKDFILDKVFSANDGDEKAAWSELEAFLISRIEQAKDSPKSPKGFQQITDEILRKKNS